MFVITKNNPYYPSVAYRETLDEACKVAGEFEQDMTSEDGEYECRITIAEVVEDKIVRSDH
jgi:hypothetical protein